MKATDLRPKNISVGRFMVFAGLYLLITLAVSGILYLDYVYDIGSAVGVGLEPILFVIALALGAFLLQRALSGAYGGGRVADFIVSLPMLLVTGVAFLLWLDIPVMQDFATAFSSSIGVEIVFTPNSYKRTTMLLFLAVALWDVVIRDILGKGRRSRSDYGGTASGRAERLEEQKPHQPMHLGSESGEPFFEGEAPIELFVPKTAGLRFASGTKLEIPVNERLEKRIVWNVGRPKDAPSDTKRGQGGTDAGT